MAGEPIGRLDDRYQAFLTVGALPEVTTFPGRQAELLFAPLEAVSFPVDCVVHARWLGNREAVTRVLAAFEQAPPEVTPTRRVSGRIKGFTPRSSSR